MPEPAVVRTREMSQDEFTPIHIAGDNSQLT